MRAAQHIVSGGLAFAKLMEVLQSALIRGSMDDLPVWWCPEIHDLGLLVHAATCGLFLILGDCKAGITNGVFCPRTIKQRSLVIAKQVSPMASFAPEPSNNNFTRQLSLSPRLG
jgi:hypothetical protein